MSKTELLKKKDYKFKDLLEIIEILRSPDGCPWDREQTHASIRKELIEETYEVVEGIDKNDSTIMCEELGDLLLQIVFHASIAKSDGEYDIDDICDGICKKLIYRHPHVFGDITAKTSEAVLANWDELKKKEKGLKSNGDVLDSVSKSLPSLMRAQKLIKKSGIPNGEPKIKTNIIGCLESLNKDNANVMIADIVFEAARLANIYKIDLEKAVYEKNDNFCDKNRKKL